MRIKDIKEYGYYVDNNDNNIIVEAFKDDDILDSNGKISREKLGKFIFSTG